MSLSKQESSPVRVFISYSHKDERFRSSLSEHLDYLKQSNEIKEWYDGFILAGESIPESTLKNLDEADIVLFLFSSHFFASEECREEWKIAGIQPEDGRMKIRVPIILRSCSWKDVVGETNIKVLPKDAKPVVEYRNVDLAWQEVYEELKLVINKVRNNFEPKPAFIYELEKTDIVSEKKLNCKRSMNFQHYIVIDHWRIHLVNI